MFLRCTIHSSALKTGPGNNTERLFKTAAEDLQESINEVCCYLEMAPRISLYSDGEWKESFPSHLPRRQVVPIYRSCLHRCHRMARDFSTTPWLAIEIIRYFRSAEICIFRVSLSPTPMRHDPENPESRQQVADCSISAAAGLVCLQRYPSYAASWQEALLVPEVWLQWDPDLSPNPSV